VLFYTCLNIPVIPWLADSGLLGDLLSSLFNKVKKPNFTKHNSVLYLLICKMGYSRK